jgi:outer membrane lipoprotein LolB
LLSQRPNYLFSIVFFLLVGGCASLPQDLPAAGGFHLRGKMGVVQASESFSARFLWRQNGAAYALDLWGPLGQGRVQLTGNRRRLELRDGEGAVISRGTPEAVMVEHLGFSLPLAVLEQWVRGRPAAEIPLADAVYDDSGRLTAFSQLDWHVQLERYRPVGPPPGQALPHRVTASRDDYRVRLAISEWQI